MKKKLLSFIVYSMCTMLLSTTVFGAIYGGKWVSNPTYYISSTNAYYTAVTNAVSSWNSALSSISANISIKTDTILGAVISIKVDNYGNSGWNAEAETRPNLYSGTYTHGYININTKYMDAFSSAKKKAIITHEFGHILGLDHNYYTSPKTLMYSEGSSVYYDIWGISTPQAKDISDIDSIY